MFILSIERLTTAGERISKPTARTQQRRHLPTTMPKVVPFPGPRLCRLSTRGPKTWSTIRTHSSICPSSSSGGFGTPGTTFSQRSTPRDPCCPAEDALRLVHSKKSSNKAIRHGPAMGCSIWPSFRGRKIEPPTADLQNLSLFCGPQNGPSWEGIFEEPFAVHTSSTAKQEAATNLPSAQRLT